MSIVKGNRETQTNVEVVPVAGRIGAVIKGIALSEKLDSKEIDLIRQALLKHKVIFFRDQTHLDDAGQEAVAALLGDPVAHPTVPIKQGSSYLLELNSAHGGRANSWHTDVSFVDAYPQASILRAVTVPEAGGDTVWANAVTAYSDLPYELRQLADRLWALHTNDFDYAARQSTGTKADQAHNNSFTSTLYETEHPLVRVHPETGERSLLLGHFVKKIIGFSSADSAKLVSLLQSYVTRLENTVRWRWSAGDVAIWDNRATQHYAVNDYGNQHRIVRRVTIAGDVPVSVDGRQSFTRRTVKNHNQTQGEQKTETAS